LSKSPATTKGHFNQQWQDARTKKIKNTKIISKETDMDHGIKTQFIYAATIDAGQIYTDQTGRFPVVSSKGKSFPMHLRDILLPQVVVTLNMLRTSRINPQLSDATHIFGQCDFNRTPMAPREQES
jgi:hypothetical protein